MLRIHNGGCFETLNLLRSSRSSSYKIFPFCDVLHETKKNVHKLESSQYGLEIIFKLQKANMSILSNCEVNTLCCRHRSHWRWSTCLTCAGSLAWHLNEKKLFRTVLNKRQELTENFPSRCITVSC